MNRFYGAVGVIVELAILVGLWWMGCWPDDSESRGLCWRMAGTLLAFQSIIYLPLGVVQWFGLRQRKVPARALARLVFVSGPTIVLSIALIAAHTFQLEGGATKERQSRGGRHIIRSIDEGNLTEAERDERYLAAWDQWWQDDIEKMKSQRVLVALLLATLLVSYGRSVQAALLQRGQ